MSKDEKLGDKSISAFLWVLVDKLLGSVVNFVVTIILARLLFPEDFGLVAMVMIFFELSYVFVESGFMTALVREKEISEIDKSTTFIFNLASSFVLYTILFFGAPAIAAFFDQELLVWIVRIMGINLIINAFAIIQRATLTQRIDFKTQTKVRFVAVLISGGVAIALALTGWGVWALVARFGVMGLMDTIFLWVWNPWKPSLKFSGRSFRRLFGFGSKILAAAILDKFYVHVYNLLIGKFFAAAILGYYSQAANFKNMAINTLFQAIQKVTYPVLSKLQDELERLKEGYRKVIKLSTFIILPAMVFLGVLAELVIVALVGEKWLPSVVFLQLLCLAGATFHFSAVNLNMLLVIGRSDVSLRLEVIKKVNITIAILIGIQYGIYGLVIGEVVSSYINLIINAYYSDKFLNYSLLEQIKDVLPTIVFSGIAGGVIFFLKDIPISSGILLLTVVTAIGALCYVGLHFFTKTKEMALIREIIIPKLMTLLGKSFYKSKPVSLDQ
jgi:teichuronic acid exporter